MGQGFVRAGPKDLPHGPCTGEPASRVLTFHSGINAAALAYFRASYSFEKNKTKQKNKRAKLSGIEVAIIQPLLEIS